MASAAAQTAAGQKNDLLARTISPEEQKKRERAVRRIRELDAEYRNSWEATHTEIIDFIQPNRGRFFQTDTNRGSRKDNHVINNFACDKARKLEAAIDVGVCSEAREWFVVGLDDPTAMEDRGNREYCHDYEEAMFAGLERVGFYAPNRNAIGDVVGPAIGAVIIEENDETIARCTHIPVGQYRVAADSSGEVNVFCRIFTYTAAQMAEEFGPENCSIAVRSSLRRQQTQTSKFTVCQLIEQRAAIEREHGKIDAKNMPWASTWLELGQGYVGAVVPGQIEQSLPTGPLGLLRESGYQEQPFYVYRWNQIGQDAYGIDSPGWHGLGDQKQLQDMELGSASMLALLLKPPMNVPDSLANASLLPDARNPIAGDQHVKFEPSYAIPPQSIEVTAAEKREVEKRLNNVFFGDILFLLSANQNPEPKTAEEIRGIKEERMLQLGGVFARISAQLKIALKRFAGIFGRRGMLPVPPQGLISKGLKLHVDFVNPLVTAQKAMGFTGMQQVINLAIQLGEAKKAGADQLDDKEILDTAVDVLGLKPNILFSDEELAANRQAVAQQAEAQQQSQSLPEAAGAIKDLSNTDPEKLQSLLQRFGPNAVTQGTA